MKTIDINMIEELSACSPWVEVNNSNWDCLTHDKAPKLYKKNESVYHQESNPDFVYLVKKGRVRLDIYGLNGEKRSLFIATDGTFLGEMSPIDGLSNICSAVAAIDSWLYAIPKQQFLDELHLNHEFSLNVLKLICKKMRLMTTQIKQLSFNNSYYRVCYVLANLVTQYGVETKNGHRLNMKFTHQEMANLTGLSRVSVSNILLDMTYNNVIEKNDGYLLIKDIDALNFCLKKNT